MGELQQRALTCMRMLMGPPLSTSTICKMKAGMYTTLKRRTNESDLAIPGSHQDLPLAEHQSPDWREVRVKDPASFNGGGVQLVGLQGVGEALIPQTHNAILAT